MKLGEGVFTLYLLQRIDLALDDLEFNLSVDYHSSNISRALAKVSTGEMFAL